MTAATDLDTSDDDAQFREHLLRTAQVNESRGWVAFVGRWMTWRTLLFALVVLHLIPVWTVTYLPTQDGPAHIYNSRIWFEQFDRANYQIRQQYEFGYQLYPNMLTHLMLGALQVVLPYLIAEKIVFSLLVALVPISMLYLLNSIQRGREVMCLIGFTFAYHNLLHIGFYNFSLSVSMCMFSLGWWWRHRDSMSLPRLGVFYLLALLTYVSHFVGFMALVMTITLAVGWMTILRLLKFGWLKVRRKVDAEPIEFTPLLMWTAGMVAILLPLWATGWDYNFRFANSLHEHFVPRAALDRIFQEHLTLLSYSKWHLELTPFVLWTMAGVAGLTVVYRLVRFRILEERDALLLAVAALVHLFYTMPSGRNAGGWVNERLFIFAMLLAWAWMGGPFYKWVNRMIAVPLIGIALVHTYWLSVDYRNLQPAMHELTAAVDKVESHSTVRWEMDAGYRPPTMPDGIHLVNPWLHAPSYYGLKKDIALFDNYEAGHDYFMTGWGPAPRRESDYIVLWGLANDRGRIERHLRDNEVVHQSQNLVLLRRKQNPPNLSTWKTLPDGRRSLRLRITAGHAVGSDGVRMVPREMLFESGSFGWVRLPPARGWRGIDDNNRARDIDLIGDQIDRTLRVDLPNGRYDVTVYLAPHPEGAYETNVIANDVRVGTGAVEDKGTSQAIRYSVDVTNGQLAQTFYTTWKGTPNLRRLKVWVVSGVEIVGGGTTQQP